jgi:hypothetical protein
VVVLSWKGIGQPVPKRDVIFLVTCLFAVVWLAQLLVSFKCIRERMALGILIIQFSITLIRNMAGTVFGFEGHPLNRTRFVLWVILLGLGLSMLYSSLRFRPQEPAN